MSAVEPVEDQVNVTAVAPLAAPSAPGAASQDGLAEMADRAGLRRIHILAWRDLDDPEAGGSEVHAARIASAWAAAGIDVTVRTSAAPGMPTYARRDGYRVIRKAGRYAVFPRTAASGLLGRTGERDALVEVWNGMPFLSPLWTRCPSVVFLHHVHAEMWRMVISQRPLARLGELIEFRLAPPVYRRSRLVTLSASSKAEIVKLLGIPAANIDVVPPGVDERFSPGPARAEHPVVVAVGRLVPVKRFDLLIDALVAVKREHPTLEAVIVGEGYERDALEEQIRACRAEPWLTLPGHLDDDALVALYRRAWVLTSTSRREGWGMTITEAAACATPAVVTDIAGHRDAVLDGVSGLLAQPVGGQDPTGVASALARLLGEPALRHRLGERAREHAAQLTWEATARGTLQVLVDRAGRTRPR